MVESGEWRVEGGKWRVEGGEWRVEGGEWRVEGGEWRVEGGGWRVESGGWRAFTKHVNRTENKTIARRPRRMSRPELPGATEQNVKQNDCKTTSLKVSARAVRCKRTKRKTKQV